MEDENDVTTAIPEIIVTTEEEIVEEGIEADESVKESSEEDEGSVATTETVSEAEVTTQESDTELSENITTESAVTSEDMPVDESETPEVTESGDNVETTTYIASENEVTTEEDNASSPESRENQHVFVEETWTTEQASMDESEMTTVAASVIEDASDDSYATDANDEETTPPPDMDGNEKEVKVEYTTTIVDENLADDEGQSTHCPDVTTKKTTSITSRIPHAVALTIWSWGDLARVSYTPGQRRRRPPSHPGLHTPLP